MLNDWIIMVFLTRSLATSSAIHFFVAQLFSIVVITEPTPVTSKTYIRWTGWFITRSANKLQLGACKSSICDLTVVWSIKMQVHKGVRRNRLVQRVTAAKDFWKEKTYLVKRTRPAVRTSSPIVNAVTSTINTEEPGHTHIHSLILSDELLFTRTEPTAITVFKLQKQ